MVTNMSEKVATGILSGVVKVSGYITGSVANSKTGKKILSLLPGEIVLASLDGFGMSDLNCYFSSSSTLYQYCFFIANMRYVLCQVWSRK